jgi:hypothetical protein
MSEETKEEVKEETAAEEKAESSETTEAAAEKQAGAKPEEGKEETPAQAGEAKKKKINRFTPEELDAKIKEVEEKNLTQSVYYKHLINRKNELEALKQQ